MFLIPDHLTFFCLPFGPEWQVFQLKNFCCNFFLVTNAKIMHPLDTEYEPLKSESL